MAAFDREINKKENTNFPFTLIEDSQDPSIQIVAGEIYEIYEEIFQDYEIYGNGPAWEALLEQALSKSAPGLLNKVSFDSSNVYLRSRFIYAE